MNAPHDSSRRAALALATLPMVAPMAALLAPRTGQAALATAAAAPDFTLRSNAGRNLRLSEHRGQVVMVNFWATWCGPCKIEMPHLVRIFEKYRSAGFVLFGVNVDEDPKAAVALAARLGITFPVLFDSDKTVSRLYALDSMPTTVLIDRDGKVRQVYRGYREGVEVTYERHVRDLVKE
jgi:peroxiredoxin